MATVKVKGLTELNRALRRTDKDVRVGIRRELRSVAEPVRADAEALATVQIPGIGKPWSSMRVGQTLDSVYVAPKQRGSRVKARQRPNLAGLLMDRALQPALDRNAHMIEDDMDEVLGRVVNNFSR